jgi:hypothetical protein
MDMHDEEIEELWEWAEFMEMDMRPQPETKREQFWPILCFVAMFAALGYLYWSRV